MRPAVPGSPRAQTASGQGAGRDFIAGPAQCGAALPAGPSRAKLSRMRVFAAWVSFLLTLLAAIGCQPSSTSAPPSTPPQRTPGQLHLNQAQPRLATLELWVGDQSLTTEIARQTVEIATGMMFRTNMADGEAMLFVFARPEPRSFYMRNTKVPLSIAYLDPEGVILEIHDMQPLDETPVESASGRVQYALEVPQGWFARRQISPGALIRTSKGPLNEINWRTLQAGAAVLR